MLNKNNFDSNIQWSEWFDIIEDLAMVTSRNKG